MKSVRLALALAGVAMVMSACASTTMTRFATKPLARITDRKVTMAVIADVLVSNGFTVVAIDEKRGLLSSDWRPYDDQADVGLNVLTNSMHTREVSLSFHVSANEYEMFPKIKLKSSTVNEPGNSKETIVYVRKGSTEERIVAEIAEQINKRLGEPNNIEWVDRLDLSGQDTPN